MDKFVIKRKVVVSEEVSYNKFIAIRVQELRSKKGFTQEEFANKIGLSRASVINIEKGRQQLSLKNLYLICKFCEVKSTEILPF